MYGYGRRCGEGCERGFGIEVSNGGFGEGWGWDLYRVEFDVEGFVGE
jgi:hypothetical protein